MLFVRFPWLGQRPLSHSYMMYENPLWIFRFLYSVLRSLAEWVPFLSPR
jgi:hypothetical protein